MSFINRLKTEVIMDYNTEDELVDIHDEPTTQETVFMTEDQGIAAGIMSDVARHLYNVDEGIAQTVEVQYFYTDKNYHIEIREL